MVRWIDGLYAGLIAGVISALFYGLLAVLQPRDASLGGFFAQISQAIPPLHDAAPSPPMVVLGVVLFFAVAATFGIVYALLARRLRSMWRAPGSVIWGLSYGLLLWFVLHDVLVPVLGANEVQPLWQSLVGAVLYGVVLSELTTMAHRNQAGAVAP